MLTDIERRIAALRRRTDSFIREYERRGPNAGALAEFARVHDAIELGARRMLDEVEAAHRALDAAFERLDARA